MKDWQTEYLIEPHRIAVTGFSGDADGELIAEGCDVLADYIPAKNRWVFLIRLPTGHSVYVMAPAAAVRTHMFNGEDNHPFRVDDADLVNLETLVNLP